MSVIFFKVAATSFFLFLFVLFLTAVFVDKHDLMFKEWEEQPKHTQVIGLCAIMLITSIVTSLIGAFIAKIWGF